MPHDNFTQAESLDSEIARPDDSARISDIQYEKHVNSAEFVDFLNIFSPLNFGKVDQHTFSKNTFFNPIQAPSTKNNSPKYTLPPLRWSTMGMV